MPKPVDNSFGREEGLPFDVKQLGTPTAYSLPECNGTLWELNDGELPCYRCPVWGTPSPRIAGSRRKPMP
jgi:hypothetical protein